MDSGMSSSRPSLRRVTALVILLAWAGALGWLGQRQLGRSEVSALTATAALRLAPSEAWFAMMAGETQVGLVGVTLDTLSPGYSILENHAIELPRGDTIGRASRTSSLILAPDLGVSEFTSTLISDDRRQVVDVRGTGSAGLALRLTTNGRSVRSPFAETEVAVPLLVAPYRLVLTGALGAGQERTLALVSGWPFATRAGRALPMATGGTAIFADSAVREANGIWRAAHFDTVATRSVLLDAPGGQVHLTLDERGGLVGLEYPFGVRWVRTDFGIASQAFRERLDTTYRQVIAVLPEVRPLLAFEATADGADTLPRAFTITRRDGSAVAPWALGGLEASRQQRVDPSTLTVGVAAPSPRNAPDAATIDPLVQAEAPEIVALAAELAGPLQARDWTSVATALRRRVTLDTSITAAEDALGTLQAGRGRPDGLARLFVAIVEAGGGDARYVLGVAPRGEVLYTHAWAEVRDPLRRTWMSVDPVRGGARAATDLIRLAWAGSSHPDDLMPYVADVRFAPAAMPSTEREELP
jgi:hypothetical protein